MSATAVQPGAAPAVAPDVSPGAPPATAASGVIRVALRAALAAQAGAVRLLGAGVRRRAPVSGAPQDILLTLNFHAAGWPRALLAPLVASGRCRRLRLVTTSDVSGLPGAEIVHPPAWLRRAAGATGSRLLTFAWLALRTRPDVVGGVHLLLNGLVAQTVARAVGARALYICVGGPNEAAGGGLWSENRLFGRIGRPDAGLEASLLRAVRAFDLVVTMGTGAAAWFSSHGVRPRPCAIPSGVEAAAFPAGSGPRDVDVIVVARLVPLKRLDLFVRTIGLLAAARPGLRAVIVGRGPEREATEALVARLGLEAHVEFLGHAPDVAVWLRRAKVFLLTSDTEGVSISLLEAMLSAAVPVVSAVGDLADVVEQDVNGVLVPWRTADEFAAAVAGILDAPARAAAMSAAARATAEGYDPIRLAGRWAAALDGQAQNEERHG